MFGPLQTMRIGQGIAIYKLQGGSMIKAFFNVDVHNSRQIKDNAQIIGVDSPEKIIIVITNAEEVTRKIQTICKHMHHRNRFNKFKAK